MLASHLSPRVAAPRRASRRATTRRWRGGVHVIRAGPADGDADPSAKRTLSALDSLLGADAPDPFDVALEEATRARDDDEPAAIRVPLI